ncbi:MAG TPA: SMC-Scp complex subunit ScpB, partial [bacterium]|nr:SMC-Scp complex subunit ScpB [bacterium]
MDKEQLMGAVEALIFVSGDPVPIRRLAEVLEESEEDLREAIETLNHRYLETGSGLQVLEVAGGVQLRTRPVYSSLVNRFLERKRKTTLSGPALETL